MKKTSRANFVIQCKTVSTTCAATHLRRASRAMNQMYAAILAPTGLQPTQFSLLVACVVGEGLPISALAEALVMDRTTLARNLKPLEKRGLVRIVPGTDRRVRMAALTELGRATLARALPLWEKAQKRVTVRFGQERLDYLLLEAAKLVTVAQSK